MPASKNLVPNMAAFLDMIAWSEIGPDLLKITDDGYNVLVGSTPEKPLTFGSYSEMPYVFNAQENSDAAGRYQFMHRYWTYYQKELSLPDFGPESQDKWAIQLVRECHAIELVNTGQIEAAIHACGSRWASFPDNTYNQRQNSVESLIEAYQQAGGELHE